MIAVGVAAAALGCGRDYLPKPKGFNRLDLPTPSYRPLPDTFPYRFEYSAHAKLLKDTSWIRDRFWIEIYYPGIKSNIHITYKRLDNREDLLREFLDDSFNLTAKHQVKAYSIEETIARTSSGKAAVISEIQGDVASQMQFVMTDSVRHFMRGALYFNTQVNNDSLAPAIDYMKREVMHLIHTLHWK